MGNEIAYHDISCANQIQNFLKQGVLSPCNLRQRASSLPCEHLAHTKIEWRPCISGMVRKGEGGAEWGLRPLLPFFDDSWGNEPLGGIYNWSRWKHGIRAWNLYWNGTNLRIYYKVGEWRTMGNGEQGNIL